MYLGYQSLPFLRHKFLMSFCLNLLCLDENLLNICINFAKRT